MTKAKNKPNGQQASIEKQININQGRTMMKKRILIVLLCSLLSACVYGASAGGGSGSFQVGVGTGMRF